MESRWDSIAEGEEEGGKQEWYISRGWEDREVLGMRLWEGMRCREIWREVRGVSLSGMVGVVVDLWGCV